MALKYKKKKIVLNFDKEHVVEKYVAANVLIGSIGYEKLCSEVNQKTGIHRGIVDVVLKGLTDSMITFLEEGFSVKLGEFGSLRPTINSESQDKMEDVNANTIIRKKIVFTPGGRLKRRLEAIGVGQVGDEKNGASNGDGSGGDSGDEAPDPEL